LTTFQPLTNELLSTDLSAISGEKFWLAVQTRPRYEKKVALELQEKGIQAFLPLYSVKHQWSDRKRFVSLPLFPGYTFVRIAGDQDIRVAVLRTNGVYSFVGGCGFGTPIPDEEIAAVRGMIEHRIPFQLCPFLKTGQRVRIRGGCLDGMRGILTAIKGNHSLVVSVDLLQRSVAMLVAGFQIEPD
jgi:transcription termination/antitermination protein NusG